MSNINISLTEKELQTAISGLLFSCSVNVVSNTDKEFQINLLSLATKLKENLPNVQLENLQFLKEEDYEDEISQVLFDTFNTNMKVVTFEQV
jgi:hypothetical protein